MTLAACGGGGDGEGPTTTPPGVAVEPTAPPEDTITVVSDDGKLTLTVPRSGLADAGVEITATAVPLGELPEALSVLRGAGTGYQLEPDGLEFSEPAEVRLELDAEDLESVQTDEGVTTVGLVTLSPTGEREALDGLVTEASLTLGTLAVRGRLDHLGYLGRTRGSITFSLDAVDAQQALGSTFAAAALITNSDDSGTVSLRTVDGTFMAFGPVSVAGTAAFTAGPLAPGESFAPMAGEFRCDAAGFASYAVDAGGVSLVEVEGEVLETPLRILVERSVECVAQ